MCCACEYAWQQPKNHHYQKQCSGWWHGQFLLDSCIAFEHLHLHLLPLPPSWVILSHSFHRDTGFSYIDWKPHSQRSWCQTADSTIASNGSCSTVQTEGAFSVILLNPCIRKLHQGSVQLSAIHFHLYKIICLYIFVRFFSAYPL